MIQSKIIFSIFILILITCNRITFNFDKNINDAILEYFEEDGEKNQDNICNKYKILSIDSAAGQGKYFIVLEHVSPLCQPISLVVYVDKYKKKITFRGF